MLLAVEQHRDLLGWDRLAMLLELVCYGKCFRDSFPDHLEWLQIREIEVVLQNLRYGRVFRDMRQVHALLTTLVPRAGFP